MPGRVQFVFGLANDELGHLIPKSEWEAKPPYLCDSNGRDAGRIIHVALVEFCREGASSKSGE